MTPAKPYLRRLLNIWPPFLGAGIRITHLDPSFHTVDVEMKLRFWNRNYVGTHYGGSLYSMTDPFFMVMLMNILGPGYIVWDKSATIRFRRPGRGTVRAHFEISDEQTASIRQQLEAAEKIEPTFVVAVKDTAGEVIAEVQKVLSIRRKQL
jgi:acyl-coenzyme A thioesterase PaaI-like protein